MRFELTTVGCGVLQLASFALVELKSLNQILSLIRHSSMSINLEGTLGFLHQCGSAWMPLPQQSSLIGVTNYKLKMLSKFRVSWISPQVPVPFSLVLSASI